MNNPTVTILLSTYNGEKYLREQIKSIMTQQGEFKLWLMIRDDGSQDKTIEIIQEFQENYNNISLILGNNVGVNDSFFYLIENAKKSDYYAIADQDDYWLPDKIQKALDVFKANENIMLYGSADICVDKNMNYISKEPLLQKPITIFNTMIQNFVAGHTQVFSSTFVDILKKDLDKSKIYAYDAYITNVAMFHNGLYFDNNAYVYYRLHENNTVGTSVNFIEWLRINMKRIRNNEGHKYAVQFECLLNKYRDLLLPEQREEFERFINCRENFFTRLYYLPRMKFTRQNFMETVVFKIYYLLGGWK